MLVIPSVSPSVCPRHKSSKECSDRKNDEEQSCSKFSEDDSYSSDFFSCVTHSRTKRVFRFRPHEEVQERRSLIEKVKRSNLVCYPKKNHILPRQASCSPYSRARRVIPFLSRAKRVFMFAPLLGSTRRRSLIEKVNRSDLVCYPKKIHIPPRQASCSPRSRAKRVFCVFSTLRKCNEGDLRCKM